MIHATARRVAFTAAVLAAITAASPTLASCLDEAPVPTTVEVSAPGPDIPDMFARFLGLWSNGKWDGKLCNSLLVSSIDAEGNAEVVYAWGAYDGWRIDKSGFVRSKAKMKDNELRLETFGNGAKAKYWFEGDVLKGRYEGRSAFYFVDLQKIE